MSFFSAICIDDKIAHANLYMFSRSGWTWSLREFHCNLNVFTMSQISLVLNEKISWILMIGLPNNIFKNNGKSKIVILRHSVKKLLVENLWFKNINLIFWNIIKTKKIFN
jgi:hypothetical protein